MLEFAVFGVPVLIALLWGIFQFGIVFKNWVALTDAVRVAARAAAVCRFPGNPSANTAFYQAATDLSGATFGPDPACPNNGGTYVDVSGTAPYTITIPFIGMSVISGNLSSTIHERIE